FSVFSITEARPLKTMRSTIWRLAIRQSTLWMPEFTVRASATGIDVRHSALSNVCNIVDVLFAVGNQTTHVTEKFSVHVNATEVFPFLVHQSVPLLRPLREDLFERTIP